jgi:hypothetical protein
LVIIALLTGCVSLSPMASMQPKARDGLDIVYQNGVPVTLSRGLLSDVVVAPVTGPSGRYAVGNRVEFVVGVRNRSGERVDVSEANFELLASGVRGRTVSAAEIEDAIRSDAASRQAALAFSAGVASFAAGMSAGRSTATVYSNGSTATVSVYNPGEAQRAQRDVARDYAQASTAVAVREQAALEGTASVLQRNTLLPNSAVSGFVFMDFPRAESCTKVVTVDSVKAGPQTEKVLIPCRFTLLAHVGSELHTIIFDEAFAAGPPAAEPAVSSTAPSEPTFDGPARER